CSTRLMCRCIRSTPCTAANRLPNAGQKEIEMLGTRDVTVLTVPGSARERGLIHGEALRASIGSCIARWKDALHNVTGLHADTYLDRFLETADFTPAINRSAMHLLE